MMRKNSLVVVLFVLVALVTGSYAEAPKGWETDVDVAIKRAKKENKAVMIEFTGSDWCPPCIAMNKNVFSKDEFFKEASKDFILVHLDFPQKDPELAKKNLPMHEKYKVPGYPFVVLLDSEGKQFSAFPAVMYPDVDKFLNAIKLALENKDLD